MELLIILIFTVIVASLIFKFSNKNFDTNNSLTSGKKDQLLSEDDIIKLRETVGRFKKGEKHYCYDCDSVFVHLEEDQSSDDIVMGVFWFFLPWKWSLVASLFYFKDEKVETVCIGCYPSFYDDWVLYKRRQSRRKFGYSLMWLFGLLCLFLFMLF
jgi:hypothetical protein